MASSKPLRFYYFKVHMSSGLYSDLAWDVWFQHKYLGTVFRDLPDSKFYIWEPEGNAAPGKFREYFESKRDAAIHLFCKKI